jgi:hypothetical protein
MGEGAFLLMESAKDGDGQGAQDDHDWGTGCPTAGRTAVVAQAVGVPLGALVIAFIAFSLPRYLSLDPAQSRVPATFSGHYPLLVAHVVFGAVAMVASVPQVWPWFRARYRKAHKVIGRVYVYGGVLPAGLTGLVVGAASPFGPVVRVNNVVLALLWLGFTIVAVRRARQRQFGECCCSRSGGLSGAGALITTSRARETAAMWRPGPAPPC